MKKYLMLVAVLMGCTMCPVQAQHVMISEALASNSLTLTDEDGESSDWVELFNPTAVPVQLGGYRLSDKNSYATAWELPDTVLQPGAALVVLASGKNRSSSGYYGLKAYGAGMGDAQDADSFYYTCLPLTGKFEMTIRLRSVAGTGPDAAAGLMIRNDLGPTSRYAAVFATGRDRYLTRVRRDTVPEASSFAEMRGSLDFPHTWLRMYRDADTIVIHQSIDGCSWQWFHTYFLPLGDTVYAGLAAASHDPVNPVIVRWTDLTINNISVAFSALSPHRIGTGAEGSSFSSAELHTDFSLDRDGEVIRLWDAEGRLVDELAFGPQHTDISCGRREADGEILLFAPPTPGAANGPGYGGLAAPPQCTPGGVFDTPVAVQLSTDEKNARIYYTLDGSEPTEQSFLSTGEPLVIDRTTVVRARQFVPGKYAPDITTRTYIVREPSTDLPIVSVTSDPRRFWSDSLGIFAYGPNASPEYPYYGANFWLDREIPVHIGLFEPDGSGATFDAGAKIHGFGTRILPQRSLRILARSRYGAGMVQYPLFPDRNIQEFNSFILRNGGNDWTFTFLRDPLASVLCAPLGLDVQAYRPCRAYLNGEYWGLVNLRERIDEYYIAGHYGISPDSVDMLENMAVATAGSACGYHTFLDSVATADATTGSYADYLRSQMDMENYIDYNCAEIYAGNSDWPGNNVRFWRSPEHDNRWRWFVYDVDGGFGFHDDYTFNTLAFAMSPVETKWTNPPWSTFLLRRVLASPQVRIQFINRFADLLNSAFAPGRVLPVIDSLAGHIAAEVPLHRDRWDSSLAHWDADVEILRDFARQRPGSVRSHIMQQFALPGTTAVRLQVDNPSHGVIRINTLTPAAFPFEGIYFQGVPVPVTAVAQPGYAFTGWSDSSLPSDPSVIVRFTQDSVTLTAYFGKSQTAVDEIVINELMYKPADERDCRDWVELYNAGEGTTDLGNWRMTDDKADHIFTFPVGTLLPPGSFLVVCEDTIAFKSVYPGVQPLAGNFSFGFGSDNDMVRLYSSQGTLMDSIAYRSTAPWPTGAPGTGRSIELREPSLDNAQGGNWQTSSRADGSPGAPNGTVSGVSASAAGAGFRCYPVPLTSTARVEYTLLQAASVRLVLCDYLGREVALCADMGRQNAGSYTVLISAPAPAGMYFLRLETRTGEGRTIQTLPVLSIP